MPALGKTKANPGFRPSANPVDDLLAAARNNNDDDDDVPVLDDATRKLIMQDIRNDRMPTNSIYTNINPRAGGTGAQGASYLLMNSGGGGSSNSSNSINRSVGTTMQSGSSSATAAVSSAGGMNLNNRRTVAPPHAAAPTRSGTITTAPVKPKATTSASSQHKDVAANNSSKGQRAESEPSAEKDSNALLDPELVEVMLHRMRFLEKQVSFLQSEVKEKSIKLSDSQNRLSDAEDAVTKLQSEKFYLAEKVASMNQFLADYGLKWAGETATAASASTQEESAAAPPPKKFDLYSGGVTAQQCMDTADKAASAAMTEHEIDENQQQQQQQQQPQKNTLYPTSSRADSKDRDSSSSSPPSGTAAPPLSLSAIQFDFDRFVNNCEGLSSKVSQHETYSDRRGGSTSATVMLRPRDVVRVVVFADGITVHGGPFRPFGWALCDAFVQDVMDGYFPYEYRTRYPDGFPIEVIDKRSQTYLVGPSSSSSGGGSADDERHHTDNSKANSSCGRSPTRPSTNIKSLNDSPYSLRQRPPRGSNSSRKGHADQQQKQQQGKGANQKKESAAGRVVGGTRHPGVVPGGDVTRDIILRRMPTRYVTATGRIINPAAGLRDFLGVAPPPAAATSADGGTSAAVVRPRTPPRLSRMRPRDEAHRKELEEEEAQAKRAAQFAEKQQQQQQQMQMERASSQAAAAAATETGAGAADDGDCSGMLMQRAFSRAMSGDGPEAQRHVRVIFPTGEDCVVSVPGDSTVQQLHDAIHSVAPPHLTRPPLDFTHHAPPPSRVIINGQLQQQQQQQQSPLKSLAELTAVQEMQLHARVPARSLVEKEQRLAAVGIGLADTVLVKWKRM